jgi:hypothetical protein
MSRVKHPMQPVVMVSGVARFKQNAIVRHLTDSQPWVLNRLATMDFSKDDWTQFYQLIGYSVSGFGDLSLVDKKVVVEADALVDAMIAKRTKRAKRKESK